LIGRIQKIFEGPSTQPRTPHMMGHEIIILTIQHPAREREHEDA
jgi:hypothetical protein